MIKHPQFLGFKLGLKFRIAPEGVKYEEYFNASEQENVVYVALLAGAYKHLKKDEVIKVGQTGRSMKSRWVGTLGIFNPKRNLRKNEKEDRRRWLNAAKKREVHVWVRPAKNMKMKYGKEISLTVSTRWAEEEYLDKYYRTKKGQRMESEKND